MPGFQFKMGGNSTTKKLLSKGGGGLKLVRKTLPRLSEIANTYGDKAPIRKLRSFHSHFLTFKGLNMNIKTTAKKTPQLAKPASIFSAQEDDDDEQASKLWCLC